MSRGQSSFRERKRA